MRLPVMPPVAPMLAKLYTYCLFGIQAVPVEVEVVEGLDQREVAVAARVG